MEVKSKIKFISLKDFVISEEGSCKRIKIDTIEEYYMCKKGRLNIIHSGRRSVFEYAKIEQTKELLNKIDSLFCIMNL